MRKYDHLFDSLRTLFHRVEYFLYLSFIYYKRPASILYRSDHVRHLSDVCHPASQSQIYWENIRTEQRLDKITFSIIVFWLHFCLILIPVDFLVAFVHPDGRNKLIYVTAIFISLFYLFRILRYSSLLRILGGHLFSLFVVSFTAAKSRPGMDRCFLYRCQGLVG